MNILLPKAASGFRESGGSDQVFQEHTDLDPEVFGAFRGAMIAVLLGAVLWVPILWLLFKVV
jgi:hypothetical protein